LSLQYIFANAVEEGYLLRGTLTFGEFFADYVEPHKKDFVVLGKALNEAYVLSDKQQWHGCIIDRRALTIAEKNYLEFPNDKITVTPPPEVPDLFSSFDNLLELFRNPMRLYQVPMKNSNEELSDLLVLDWVRRLLEIKYNLRPKKSVAISPQQEFDEVAEKLNTIFDARPPQEESVKQSVRAKKINTITFAEIMLRTIK
jgi:hypothetical protein